jgi:glycosyltransferase involved in cell wall biosynthesis
MRYAWDLEGYLAGSSLGLPARAAAHSLRPWLQWWDLRMSRRPDVIVANSTAVRDRIQRLWRRDAHVIHPPVDTSEFSLSTRDDGYYLVAARLVAYRRVDLAVEAATRLGRDLVVVGDGPEMSRLRDLAGATVRFFGTVDRGTLVRLFERCHAYVVPGEEDFGIAPVEAMAAGKPVIAYRGGGALDTVVAGLTGIFFDSPRSDELAQAMEGLEHESLDPREIRRRAQQFDVTLFRRRWGEFLLDQGAPRDLVRPE